MCKGKHTIYAFIHHAVTNTCLPCFPSSHTILQTDQVISKGEALSEAVHDASEAVSEAMHDASEAVSEAVHDASEKVSEVVHDVSEKVQEAVHDVGEKVHDAVVSASAKISSIEKEIEKVIKEGITVASEKVAHQQEVISTSGGPSPAVILGAAGLILSVVVAVVFLRRPTSADLPVRS
jgi:gas vesicle protein